MPKKKIGSISRKHHVISRKSGKTVPAMKLSRANRSMGKVRAAKGK